MKKLGAIIFVISLFLGNSFAFAGKDSWDLIRSSPDIYIQQPTFAGVFGPRGLFNACTTDDEFKSKSPVKTCIEYRQEIRQSKTGTYNEYVCAIYEMQPISIGRTYIKNICIRYSPLSAKPLGECIEYRKITSKYPTSFSFAVFDGSPEEYGNFLFTKTFALKTCE